MRSRNTKPKGTCPPAPPPIQRAKDRTYSLGDSFRLPPISVPGVTTREAGEALAEFQSSVQKRRGDFWTCDYCGTVNEGGSACAECGAARSQQPSTRAGVDHASGPDFSVMTLYGRPVPDEWRHRILSSTEHGGPPGLYLDGEKIAARDLYRQIFGEDRKGSAAVPAPPVPPAPPIEPADPPLEVRTLSGWPVKVEKGLAWIAVVAGALVVSASAVAAFFSGCVG